MTRNPDRNGRRTGSTDDPSTETGGGDTDAPGSDAGDATPTEATLTRRNTLVGASLGLGLLSGLRAPGQGRRRWNQDVDAGGNDLLDLGGLNLDSMAEDALVTALDGANLEIDDASLNLEDRIDVDRLRATEVAGAGRVATDELAGGVTGGRVVTDLAGNDLRVAEGRLDAVTRWRRGDALLEPSDDGVDGIEVGDVESPDEEGLNVEADGDLVLSISGGEGAVRIETEGGHEIVLDDTDGSESISIEDDAGNSVEMDAAAGEVSISATERIALDAPRIDLSADADITIRSEGLAALESAAVTSVEGSIVKLNGPGRPAARQGDRVEDGRIAFGSPTVLIG